MSGILRTQARAAGLWLRRSDEELRERFGQVRDGHGRKPGRVTGPGRRRIGWRGGEVSARRRVAQASGASRRGLLELVAALFSGKRTQAARRAA